MRRHRVPPRKHGSGNVSISPVGCLPGTHVWRMEHGQSSVGFLEMWKLDCQSCGSTITWNEFDMHNRHISIVVDHSDQTVSLFHRGMLVQRVSTLNLNLFAQIMYEVFEQGRLTSPEEVELDITSPPADVGDVAERFLVEDAPSIRAMDVERDAIAMTMQKGIPTILVGHTGTAKTKLLARVHQEAGWPYRSVPGHGQIEVDTLVGKIWVQDGEMVFRPGILPFCMKYGIALGIQEINAVVPEVLILLHEYVDEGYITIMDLPPEHEWFIVEPHQNFRLYGTMNPPELYPGIRELSPALARRCMVRRVATLSPEDELAVVLDQAPGLPEGEVKKLIQVAAGVRKNFDQNKGMFWLSTADVIQWADLAASMNNVHRAAELAIYGKAPSIEETFVRQLVRTAIGAAPDDISQARI